MRRRRRVLAGGAVCAVLASLVAACGTHPAPGAQPAGHPVAQADKPNIVFVLTDDLEPSLVKYMPEVQKMRQEGVNFTNYAVTDSLCCPSRSSIFTGRYPHNTGVFTNKPPDGGFEVFHGRGDEQHTFATALQSAGYKTAMMGKYLNGYQPDGTVDGKPNYIPPGWNEWDVAGNGYPEFNYTLNADGTLERHGNTPQDYLTDVVAAKGDKFIRTQAAAHNPFLLEIATFAPHAPYTPAPRNANDFPGLTAPNDPSVNEKDVSDKPPWLRAHPLLTQQQLAKDDTTYRKRAQSVEAVSDLLHRLRSTLEETGQAKNTYVVFSSDNGYHLGQHRLFAGKQTAFETDVRVPLVVTGPDVPAGQDIARPAENIDLAPTFSRLGGTAPPTGTDGSSLIPLLSGGQPTDFRATQLIEHHGPNAAADDPDHQTAASGNPPTYSALRTGTYTYVEYIGGAHEYYDRTSDPYELTNSYGSLPAARQAELHNTLQKMTQCQGTADCTAASR